MRTMLLTSALFCCLMALAQNYATTQDVKTNENFSAIADSADEDSVVWEEAVCDSAEVSEYRCDAFSIRLYPGQEEEDSLAEFPGSKIFSTSSFLDDAKFSIAYFSVSLREELFLELCNGSPTWGTTDMTAVGDVVETDVFGRVFRNHRFEDSLYVANALYWANDDYCICIIKKSAKGGCSSDLFQSIEWLMPEENVLSKEENLGKLSKVAADAFSRTQQVEFSSKEKTITFSVRNTQARDDEDDEGIDYQKKGLRFFGMLAKTFSLFRVFAEQGYVFQFQVYDNEGKLLCDDSFNADDILIR